MSAAAVTANAAAAPAATAPRGTKKKRVLVGAAVLLLVLAIAGGGWYWLQLRAAKAATEGEDGEDAVAMADKAHGPKTAPTFMPLEPFVVNLADRDADRFAQIGITLELADAAAADRMKAFMPAIRNAILLVLADKKSQELLAREGKEKLAAEILRESVRPLGIELKSPTPVVEPMATKEPASKAEGAEGVDKPAATAKAEPADKPRKPKAEAPGQPNPVQRVHFSSFIIQ